MNFGILAKRAGKVAADNSPAILTAIAVSGVLTTAFLTAKASFKAADVIFDAQAEHDREEKAHNFSSKEKVDLVWKYYVPAVGTGIMTITCLIASNHIGTRRAAALASAYGVSQEMFKEYKDKVISKLGESGEEEVRSEIASDKIRNNPLVGVVLVGTGEFLCVDMHSGRYFKTDNESLRKAENDINWQILNENYASLSDFYDLLGLPHTSESDEIGWTTDKKFEMEITPAFGPKKEPCLAVEFRTVPTRNYHRFH